MLNTDKAPTYAAAIAEFKAEGKCPDETRHRQVKYLNNVVEADHGKLKLLLRPVRGFKTLKTAYGHDQGLRGHAGAAQGSGSGFRPPGRHHRRGEDHRACLRRRTVRSDRGHGAAAGPSGQRRIMRRPPVLLDHHTPSSGLQQSPLHWGHARQAAGGACGPEEGGRHRGAQRFRTPALVEAGRVAGPSDGRCGIRHTRRCRGTAGIDVDRRDAIRITAGP